MIVRVDKGYETNSAFLNKDWYDEGNYVIDETTENGRELADKISVNYPHYDLVVSNGVLMDIAIYPYISLTSDKTSILPDGTDTATITSDVACSFYDEEGNLLDENVNSIQVVSVNTGKILIKAFADKHKSSTIEIEVIQGE